MSDIRDKVRDAIERASRMIHDATQWSDDYYQDDCGKTVMDVLLDRIMRATGEEIARLTAENERLTTEVATAKTIAVNIGVSYEQCKAELERLQQRHNILGRENTRILNERDAAVAECERLKKEHDDAYAQYQDFRDRFHRMNTPTGREIELQHALNEAVAECERLKTEVADEVRLYCKDHEAMEVLRVHDGRVRITNADGRWVIVGWDTMLSDSDPADAILAAKGGDK